MGRISRVRIGVFAAAALVAGAVHANMMVNGDFETGDLSSWTAGSFGPGTVTVTSAAAESGAYGLHLEATGSMTGTTVYASQVAAAPIPAGIAPTFCFDFRGMNSSDSDGGIAAFIAYRSAGGDTLFYTTVPGYTLGLHLDGTWQTFSYTPAAIPDGTSFAQLMIIVQPPPPGNTTDSIALDVDNVVVSAVPEPTALSLLGMVGLLGLRRARK